MRDVLVFHNHAYRRPLSFFLSCSALCWPAGVSARRHDASGPAAYGRAVPPASRRGGGGGRGRRRRRAAARLQGPQGQPAPFPFLFFPFLSLGLNLCSTLNHSLTPLLGQQHGGCWLWQSQSLLRGPLLVHGGPRRVCGCRWPWRRRPNHRLPKHMRPSALLALGVPMRLQVAVAALDTLTAALAALGQVTPALEADKQLAEDLAPKTIVRCVCVELYTWWSHLWQADDHITNRISAHAARVRCLTRRDRHTGTPNHPNAHTGGEGCKRWGLAGGQLHGPSLSGLAWRADNHAPVAVFRKRFVRSPAALPPP